MTMASIQAKLNDVIKFLDPLLPLANSHMVDFITENLWELLTPADIKADITSAEACNITVAFHEIFMSVFDKCVNRHTTSCKSNVQNDASCVTGSHTSSTHAKVKIKQEFPAVLHFLSTTRDISLSSSSDVLSRSELQEKLISLGCYSHSSLHMEAFMTCKKAHEVEGMSEVVASLSNACHVSHIVDVGCGKGYLSSMLALHHGLSVLGIDSSQITSHGAIKRTSKLVRVWDGISKKAKLNKSTSSLPEHEVDKKEGDVAALNNTADSSINHVSAAERCKYKQATLFVTPQINLSDLVGDYFPEYHCHPHHLGLALVGLHTCGGLAPTALRIFACDKHVRGLCNVGCCYHFLNEEFILDDADTPKGSPEYDFPMSAFLHSKKFALGRNARMLAAQSVDRVTKTELSLEPIFYRAVLQVLLKEKLKHNMPEANVGRLASKCSNFPQYVQKAVARLGLDLKVSEEEIDTVYKKHLKNKEYLHAFFLLRLSLAPIIEIIIVLDRLLFLLEQGIEDAYMVQMFDPVVSPRCYGIVAWKSESLQV